MEIVASLRDRMTNPADPTRRLRVLQEVLGRADESRVRPTLAVLRRTGR